MEALPEELWEDILSRLDVFVLAKLSTVSKRWHEIVKRVMRRTFKYYEKCQREIPKKYWIPILERHDDPKIRLDALDNSKRHYRMWKSMYRSWTGWNTLLDKIPKQTTIPVTIDHLTCLDVTGNIIAVGSMFSTGFYYDLTKPDAPFYAMPCPVHGVWLWRKGDDIRAVTYSETMNNTVIKHWNVLAKKQITEVEYRRPTLISTCLDYCYTVIPYLTDEEDSLDYELRTSYTVKVERLGSGLEPRLLQLPKIGFVNFIAAEGDELLISTADYREGRINVYASSSQCDFKQIHASPWDLRRDGHVDIGKSGILWTTGIDGSKIGFSVDCGQWKFYDVQRDLKLSSNVTQILCHLGFLFLGFESGDVRIVHVEDRLESLDLATMRSVTLKFTPDPVTHLSVTEHEAKQYLVVASMMKLHVVEFQPKCENERPQSGSQSLLPM